MDIVVFALIGLAIGWAARIVLEDGGFGKNGNVIAGVIGGLAGGLLFKFLIVVVKTLAAPVAALIGAALVIAVGAQRANRKSS